MRVFLLINKSISQDLAIEMIRSSRLNKPYSYRRVFNSSTGKFKELLL